MAFHAFAFVVGLARRIAANIAKLPEMLSGRGIKNRSGFFFAEFDSLDTFGLNGWVWGLPPGGPHTRTPQSTPPVVTGAFSFLLSSHTGRYTWPRRVLAGQPTWRRPMRRVVCSIGTIGAGCRGSSQASFQLPAL